ncbi:MAG: divergent PAP2 family protein [Syntrophomonadaceae bacterium]|jgi:acid phosphatase family membrane protein YuiD|nr:divergent PAP2 family protein [Bacillota bacterium]NLJ02482.1 divergent PAP2 family protein [Bacillota bacterium]
MKGAEAINSQPVLRQIQSNEVLMAAILAWALAQVFKIISWALVSKELNFKRLVEPGGMPSSHSAFVTSLCTGVGLREGFDSTLFALAAVFAVIVMYDASGVRRAAGKQARVLNRMIEDLNRRELHPERLRELLGHTPFEVVVGAVLGIVIALWRL